MSPAVRPANLIVSPCFSFTVTSVPEVVYLLFPSVVTPDASLVVVTKYLSSAVPLILILNSNSLF